MSASYDPTPYYVPVVTVHPTKIIVHQEQVLGNRKAKQLETHKTNFQDNSHKGKISKKARKKISTALDYMMYLAKPKVIPEGYRGQGLKFKICFVTLDLPSRQVHTDGQIISLVMEPMLNYFRKHYHVTNYIWRAEKQKNGNLHFHVILDKFIDKYELRRAWNKYLQNLGYVTAYKKNQLDWHNNGFTVRKKLLKHWPEQAQREAYLQGMKEDWNNPNTTDIHSTKRIKNLKKYLCKYLTKSRNEKILEEEINNSSTNDLLTISGRLWACSESLSNIKGAKTDYTTEIDQELLKITASQKSELFQSSYYTVWCIYVTNLKYLDCPILTKLWNDYINTAFP